MKPHPIFESWMRTIGEETSWPQIWVFWVQTRTLSMVTLKVDTCIRRVAAPAPNKNFDFDGIIELEGDHTSNVLLNLPTSFPACHAPHVYRLDLQLLNSMTILLVTYVVWSPGLGGCAGKYLTTTRGVSKERSSGKPVSRSRQNMNRLSR